MTWSPQQDSAIQAVEAWLKDRYADQVFYLAGFAGTGKTTLAKEFAGDVRGRVLFAAFTGKAALVLRRKGCRDASTIHSLIYKVEDDEERWQPKFRLNPLSAVKDAALVVIDECSMVGEELGRDLLSFGTKLLVLGDPAQLPPVKDAGFFTRRRPDVMLTAVHRQARDNPIIRMSMIVREGGRLAHGTYGESRVVAREEIGPGDVLVADQVLVGLNRTRRSYNDRIRALQGRMAAAPEPGDKLVCLRNNRAKKLLNGGLWTLERIEDDDDTGLTLMVSSEDQVERHPTEVYVRREFFEGREDALSADQRRRTDEFTYGYALTVHKAQGSQWDNVLVLDESSAFQEDRAKHLYTALTRAAERITVVR
jgi:exodeoxyribonuclease-5